jgi:large subunit ribosomal protein L3|uniref:Large ribosomal subunit protein uL3 n=1 Tax=Mesoaciditoga lauensis TaxID=1495039 RepID=A0A7V3VSQ7_9BACT
MKALLGKKVGMTMIFKEGHSVPVTVLKAGPCVVVQKKTVENDGYNSIQIGFEPLPAKKVTKPMAGHFKKNNVAPLRHLKEVRTDEAVNYQIGQNLDVSLFTEGDYVDISGKTKGKGFEGAVKRWNFGGHDKTHGTKFPRHGSTGMHTEPAKVMKGMHMAGHMGDVNRTISNLQIVRIDKDNSLIAVRGAVPGARGSLIYIRSAKTKKEKK